MRVSMATVVSLLVVTSKKQASKGKARDKDAKSQALAKAQRHKKGGSAAGDDGAAAAGDDGDAAADAGAGGGGLGSNPETTNKPHRPSPERA